MQAALRSALPARQALRTSAAAGRADASRRHHTAAVITSSRRRWPPSSAPGLRRAHVAGLASRQRFDAAGALPAAALALVVQAAFDAADAGQRGRHGAAALTPAPSRRSPPNGCLERGRRRLRHSRMLSEGLTPGPSRAPGGLTRGIAFSRPRGHAVRAPCPRRARRDPAARRRRARSRTRCELPADAAGSAATTALSQNRPIMRSAASWRLRSPRRDADPGPAAQIEHPAPGYCRCAPAASASPRGVP